MTGLLAALLVVLSSPRMAGARRSVGPPARDSSPGSLLRRAEGATGADPRASLLHAASLSTDRVDRLQAEIAHLKAERAAEAARQVEPGVEASHLVTGGRASLHRRREEEELARESRQPLRRKAEGVGKEDRRHKRPRWATFLLAEK